MLRVAHGHFQAMHAQAISPAWPCNCTGLQAEACTTFAAKKCRNSSARPLPGHAKARTALPKDARCTQKFECFGNVLPRGTQITGEPFEGDGALHAFEELGAIRRGQIESLNLL